MSTPVPHVCSFVLVLLLIALTHVQSLHMPTLNSNRPRLREGQQEDQRQHYNDKHYYSDSEELTESQRLQRLKEEVKDKFKKYEDAVEREESLLNSAQIATTKDYVHVSQMAQSADPYSESHVKSYATKSMPTPKQLQTQSTSTSLHNKNSQNSRDRKSSYNPQNIESDAWNSSGSDELSDEFDLHANDDDNSSLSNDTAIHNSSTDSLSNNASVSRAARCPTCLIRNDDRHYRIESLKQQILTTLRITNPPNTTGVPIPKVPALTHLYDTEVRMMSDSPYSKRHNNHGNHYYEDNYDDDFIVKTERVFTAAREAPTEINLNATDTVYFSPPVQLYTSKIKTAYLWFYLRKGEISRPHVTFAVHLILPESLPGKRLITKTVYSHKMFKDKAVGWKRIDMRDILRRWVRHPMSNYGMQMRAEDDNGDNLIVLPPSMEIDKGYEPWLDTKIEEPTSNSRHRRSDALVCSDNSTESRCCRYPLFVGFAEFGWEWIIAPTHVKADYCSGECRMTMQDNTPYSWVNQQMPGSGGSCCTPTKMSPLPLLYFDESFNILYQILQNMKVDKCGCA